MISSHFVVLIGLTGFLISPIVAAEGADLDKVFAELKQYDTGKSPVVLEQIRARMRKSSTDAGLRADLEEMMIALLAAPDATVDGKQFVCKQLGRIGTKLAVPALTQLLKDEKSAGNAVFALQTLPCPEAGVALRQALQTSPARLDIIQALSVRREKESVRVLAGLADDTDAAVADAAVIALAFFGDEDAAATLFNLSKKPARSAQVAHARLRCAQSLAEAGKTQAALKVCRQLRQSQACPQIRRGAFLGIVEHGEKEGVELFFSVLKGKDPGMRQVAIGSGLPLLGDRAPSVTAELMELMHALPPADQAALLAALVNQRGAGTAPYLLKLIESGSSEQQTAALRGLAKVGDVRAVPPLAKRAGTEGADAKLALTALSKLRGEGVDKAIVQELDNAGPVLKPRLIAVLHDRGVTSAVPRLLQCIANPSALVSVAACKAAGDLAGKEHLQSLVDTFVQLEDKKTVTAAEKAILRVTRRADAEAEIAPRVCTALDATQSVETRMALLRLLGGLPCERSFTALKKTANDSDAAVQNVALRELFDWPGVEVVPVLNQVVGHSRNKAHRVLALRAYARLLGTAKDRPVNDAAAQYVKPALQAAQRSLADKETKGAAALAIVSMAPAAAVSDPDAARAALMEAASRNKDDETIRITVEECLRSLKLDSEVGPDQEDAFFDGETLAGWQGNEKYWRVVDGAIVGNNQEKLTKNLYIWSSVSVSNFYLVVDVRVEPWNRNAGVQFRSRKVGEFGAYGYQADAGGGFWGRLFHEHGRNHLDSKDYGFKASKKDDWNRYEILAVDDCIWTAINGTLSVSIRDPKGERSGHIPFQVHAGKPQTARYRIIKLVHDPEVKLKGYTEGQLRAALRAPMN
jgi:HEAT repeat protein